MAAQPPSATTETEAPPLTRRRAETRERLLDAAITVMARTGVDQARVEDISEQAGYTRGAFYSNFADKDALILALLERQHERATDFAQVSIGTALAVQQPAAFGDLVTAALDALEECIPDDNWLLAERGLHLYALRNLETSRALAAYEAKRRAAVGELLTHGLHQVGLRALVPMDHLVTVIETIFMESKLRGAAFPPDVAAPSGRDLLISVLTCCLEPVAANGQ